MRPDNQSLSEPLDKILQGIKEFSDATAERIRSDDWVDSHKADLSHIRGKLLELETDLCRLRKENW